jgi:SAM-dependent methyltransferase
VGRAVESGLLRDLREGWGILRLAFRIRRDPIPFTRRVADGVADHLDQAGIDLQGARALDVGTGSGAIPEALARRGARAVALDVADHRLEGIDRGPFVVALGEGLPFSDGSFDVVVSSNVLEHVARPWEHVDELVRVVRPGGMVFLSWTNWYSPIGGHEWSPFHFLGPRLGIRAYRALRGKLPPWNLPGRTLFPVHVGEALREVRRRAVEVRDVVPRYWPSLRLIGRVPLLREVAMWNCVLLLERKESPSMGGRALPPGSGPGAGDRA